MVPLRDEIVSIMIDEENEHSPVLFVDETFRSLYFVIKPCKEKELIREMITAGGGEVISSPGDYGITLIPPNVDLIGNDEVFSIDYIKDCCAANKLLDLKPYRLNEESRFPDNFDPMSVLLKLQTWEEARNGLTFDMNPTLTMSPDNSNANDEASEGCETPDQSRNSLIPSDTSQFVSVSSGNSSGNDEASDGHEAVDQNRNSPGTKKKNNPSKEETDVIDCNENAVINSNENAVIDCDEDHGILHIASGSEGSCKSNASTKVVDNIIVSSDSEQGTVAIPKGRAMTSSQLRVRSARRRVIVMDSSDSEESTVGRNVKSTKILRLERSVGDKREASRQDNSRPSTSQGSGSRKETENSKSSSVSLSGSDDDLWKTSVARTKKSGAKPGRRDYTNAERLAIIQFLKKNKWQKYVKGREMWQKMELARVCPGRTWQSLKEHYIKKILPNIETYGLSKEEVKKFREPFL